MARTVFLLLGLALAGCTTASTTMLNENTALISARDLSTDSRSAVRKKALVTAAQVAKAQGYDYFAIVSRHDTNKLDFQHLAAGPIGEQGAGSYYIPVRDLGTDLTVRFLRQDELPADRDGIYEASALLDGRI